MRMIRFGVGVAFLAFLTSVANAQSVPYNWVTDSGTVILGDSFIFTPTTGNNGTISSLQWNSVSITDVSGLTATLLADGNLSLSGTAGGITWTPNASSGAAEVKAVEGGSTFYGDWVDSPVAVPEPTTVVAGALLLLPFGASTIRVLRRKSVA